ncbi:endo mannanase GH76 family [Penicillium capsulatum]|uniref:Mannan endo-1,6-alpha-mannosidase n=1 Tax=Penicillium capsulatum TaxID=69766 RepID=A0A9W9I2Y5_9EURO|nr:endo mannanase GH76 family [Penicillium capsulatum]KAJ6117537.1 endo mannanase GH76 family [Penicillium capsulatum]
MVGNTCKAFCAVALLASSASAFQLDPKSNKSIKDGASTAADNAMWFYDNRESDIPGVFTSKWWEGGALFNTLIQYWFYTDVDEHNAAVSKGLYWQSGEHHDFAPSNFSAYIGNDDQLTWALASMTAAELDFPEASKEHSWATLAENVFDVMARRWDTRTCGGGLRWQVHEYQSGYETKLAYANAAFFQLSARLARFTGNETYSKWADKIWDWSASTAILDTKEYKVIDSVSCKNDCKEAGKMEWSYNYGAFMSGAAYMYSVTNGEAKWKTRVDGLLKATTKTFFPESYDDNKNVDGKTLIEITCEDKDKCSTSNNLFKSILAGDLTFVATVAPYTKSTILPLLQGSAAAAAKTCTGGDKKTLCSNRWYLQKFEVPGSLEEEIAATSIFTSNLIAFKHRDLTIHHA